MTMRLALGPLLALVAATAVAAPPPIVVRQVRGGIYEATGGAVDNTGFFIGEHEVLVVDAKMTVEATRAVVAHIRKLTPKPVGFVVLTHSDLDHVGGLAGYPLSARLISHENARRDLETATRDPLPRVHLPQLTFSERMTLHLAGTTVRLLHLGPAHTDGDVVVFFPKERVAFVGDLVFLGRDPLIHRHKRGSSTGLVKALKALLKLDADTFLSGHDRPATKADLEGLARRIEATQVKVKKLVEQKRSLAEVKKALGVAEQPGQRWPSLVETIYLELTEKR